MIPPKNNQLVKVTLNGQSYPARYFKHHAILGGRAGYEVRMARGRIEVVPAKCVTTWQPDERRVVVSGYGPRRLVSPLDWAMAAAMVMKRGIAN